MIRVLLLMIALPAFAIQSAGAEGSPPRRVISFNVCADQLVVALADPEQIAGLSPYAADPGLSVVADAARAFRRVEWQAESTVALSPDLVLVGPSDRSATRRILASLGYRVAEVGLVSTIDDARAQIVEIAALLGHPERAERLLGEIERARASLARVPRGPFRTGLVIERGGYTAGPSSLAAALAAEAGLAPPPGSPAGYGGFLSLERLITLNPDVVLLKDAPREPTDQGALFLSHPALEALYPPERRIALPARYTLCGGPGLVAALDHMRAAIERLRSASVNAGNCGRR
jgi:iron complex transport system substrate-binding protein